MNGLETYIAAERGWGAAPTNEGLTMVVMGWPAAEADAFRADPEGNFFKTFDLAPAFAERARAASRVERFTGASIGGYLRKPYGPGWVLAGDAAYNKDPITAQGIIDAFRDAESIASALHGVWSGERPFHEAMALHHTARDAQVMPIYEFTSELAKLQPPPPELQALIGRIAGNQPAMDGFVSVNAATVSPAQFFDPSFLAPLLAA
jgi:2-polyprenyl-6-methoxyphenol hydroxylase-like FAD-dependent oxidoreductase